MKCIYPISNVPAEQITLCCVLDTQLCIPWLNYSPLFCMNKRKVFWHEKKRNGIFSRKLSDFLHTSTCLYCLSWVYQNFKTFQIYSRYLNFPLSICHPFHTTRIILCKREEGVQIVCTLLFIYLGIYFVFYFFSTFFSKFYNRYLPKFFYELIGTLVPKCMGEWLLIITTCKFLAFSSARDWGAF